MQTHIGGNVFIHAGVSQRCRAIDEEPTPVTLHAESKHTKRSSGAMEERSEKGQKVSTYILSDVFVHLATIKIGRAASVDEEPTTTIPISIALQKAST